MTPLHVEKGERPTVTLPHCNGMPMEPGCYADGAFGWEHVRDVLAGLVEERSIEGVNVGEGRERRTVYRAKAETA